MIRVNLFKNGDSKRQQGRVLIVNRENDMTWEDFLLASAHKLNIPDEDGLCAYSHQGGRLESLSDLIQDDVLFLSHHNEPFNYDIVEQNQPQLQQEQEQEEEAVGSESEEQVLEVHVKHIQNLSDPREFTFRTTKPERRNIAKLKKWLAKQVGCHRNDISIVMKGKRLDDKLTFVDCFGTVDKEFTVFMLITPFTLYVKQMRGGSAIIKIQESDHVSYDTVVSDLKTLIAKKTGIPDCKLLYQQKVMLDGEKLSSYDIMSESVLYMI